LEENFEEANDVVQQPVNTEKVQAGLLHCSATPYSQLSVSQEVCVYGVMSYFLKCSLTHEERVKQKMEMGTDKKEGVFSRNGCEIYSSSFFHSTQL
jgi:hypothetical protein